MIFWRTDNELTFTVADALKQIGIPSRHIKDFPTDHYPESIFYGIMRGTGNIMHEMRRHNKNFWYIDNGYFDAEYIDRFHRKPMTGYYRISRGDMLEPFGGPDITSAPIQSRDFIIMPPSHYTANYYDTAPTDWSETWANILVKKGFPMKFREKNSAVDLHGDLKELKQKGGSVLAFNSMSVMSALDWGVPVYDTHGVFRNAGEILKPDFKPRVMFDFAEVERFYRPRQFTLSQIASGSFSFERGIAA